MTVPAAAPLPAMTPAYVVGRITVKSPAHWDDYRARVPATLVPFGGELVFRGRSDRTFAGHAPPADIVVIRFPSARAAADWHDSPAYQALVPLRLLAADVDLASYAT